MTKTQTPLHSGCFKDSSSVFKFQNLTMMSLFWVYHLLTSHQLSESVSLYLLPNLGCFSYYFFKYSSTFTHFLLFSDCSYRYLRFLALSPKSLILHFSLLYFLLFILGKFYYLPPTSLFFSCHPTVHLVHALGAFPTVCLLHALGVSRCRTF